MLVTLVTGRLRQEDHRKLEASLSYRVRDSVSKTKQIHKKAEAAAKTLKRAVVTTVSPRATHSWFPVTLLRPFYLT